MVHICYSARLEYSLALKAYVTIKHLNTDPTAPQVQIIKTKSKMRNFSHGSLCVNCLFCTKSTSADKAIKIEAC